MRLLIKLKSLKSAAYDLKYYHKLRGFLYGLQKSSKYFNKHGNMGYKFYSFSNILPPKDIKAGDIRTLIVSSPDSDFIKWLYGQYHNREVESLNLFEMFKFNHLEPEQKRILWLGFGSGLEEVNSSGFGFMNVMKNENSREELLRREPQDNLDEIPAAHL